MNKRDVVILFAVITFISFVEFASASADVAYLFRKNFNIDHNMIDAMNESGLSVQLINADALPPFFSFDDYRMIFVGDENFKSLNKIPVGIKPSVVVNSYHTQFWGLTDADGASQLAATHPLSVQTDHTLTQVYTDAKYPSGSAKKGAIPYYYLDKENVAENLTVVAKTEPTSGGEMFGDVITYGAPGAQLTNGKTLQAKLCFYGIVESDFWTPEAKQFFTDCLGFVGSACDKDSDCPPGSESDNFCSNGNVYKNVSLSSCFNPGKANSQCIIINNMTLIEQCQFGCENASCIKINCTKDSDCDDNSTSTEDICNFPNTTQSFCSNLPITCFHDSDCGTNSFVGSPFCTGKNVTQNFETFTCNNPGTALSSCSSLILPKINQTCSFLCSNGTCITPACTSNSDCEDNNPLTFDECLNPGTIVSKCQNTPINCAHDSDCGFTGFIGTEFCTGLNITKNYQTATCLFPGTLDSSCSVSTVPKSTASCQYVCLNGACIRCDSNSDCNDNNANTQDNCINPGQATSNCQNNPIPQENITCKIDSDCGTNQIIAGPFCSLNNVNFLERDWHCNYANTTMSFCSSDLIQKVNQTCPDYCQSGECVDIECFTHSDCNDQNSTTLDVCNNPGTPQSFCTNNPIEIICSSDSDCGISGFIPGNICVGKDVTQLFENFTCYAPGTSISFCSSSLSQKTIQTCSFLCSNGDCINPPVCGNGIVEPGEECDDSNTNDNDGCSSECEIEEDITCFQDSDCGTNSFVGSPFCTGKNLTQNFRVFTCSNEGTPQSSCSHIDTPITQTVCAFQCSPSGCVNPPQNITCYTDADCTDGNSMTYDQCIHPATPQSYCIHNPINCAHDSDCGATGLVGDKYCLGKNVTQNFLTSLCINPGLPSSHCDSSVSQYFFLTCVNVCNNGQCSECTPGQVVSCGSSTGECKQGTQTCSSSGVFGSCIGAIDPAAEICDGKDNNCNGQIDENNICQNTTCTNDCSSGSKQCIGTTGYQTCGNFDSDSCLEWSLTNQCSLGQTCSSGSCINNPPSCSDECSSGSKQCSSANTFQTCGNFDSDSCLEWSSSSLCPGGKTCTGAGICETPQPPTCTNDCSSGSKQCIGTTGYQTCGNFDSDSCLEWSLTNQCSLGQTCSSGSCINNPPSCTNDCSLGQKICSGTFGYKICGNFDSDSCLDWSLINQCGLAKSCTGAGICG